MNLGAKPSRQSGQAMTEYLIVAVVGMLGLTLAMQAGDEGSTQQQSGRVAEVLKASQAGYHHSLAPIAIYDPENPDGVSWCDQVDFKYQQVTAYCHENTDF